MAGVPWMPPRPARTLAGLSAAGMPPGRLVVMARSGTPEVW